MPDAPTRSRAGRRRLRLGAAGALLVLAPLAASACGSSSTGVGAGSGGASTSASSGGSGAKPTITIGAAAFPENQLLADVYADGLKSVGYGTKVVQVSGRETAEPLLSKGSLEVFPEYTSSLLDYFRSDASTTDDMKNLTLVRSLGAAKGVTVLNPSPATDDYAYATSTAFAQKNNITTLSQLAAYSQTTPITMGGIQECEDRSYCLAGLKSLYKLKVKNFTITVLSSQASVNLLTSGKAQLVEFNSSDGVLSGNPVVVLKDDKGLNHNDYIVPVVNASALGGQAAAVAELNKLSAALTQDKLNAANKEVQVNRKPVDEAADDLYKQLGG